MCAPGESGGATSRLSSADGHRLWAETYDSDPNPLLALESRILSGGLGDVRESLFLDLACGTGRWAAEARARGARVFGVDTTREMLLQARRKIGRGRLVTADCAALPCRDGCFDVVMLAFAFGYLERRDRVMREVHRVVRPGGSVFLSDLHPEAVRSGWTRSFRRGARVFEVESFPYTVEDLRTEAQEAGLVETEIWEARLDPPEREIFERAGREALFQEACAVPAVLAVHWMRP